MAERTDPWLGLGAVVLACGYGWQAASIEDSMLSDTIGAGGVPLGIAVMVGLCGAVVALRGLRAGAGDSATDWRAHARAAGLLALLAGYLMAVPWLGYPLAVALLGAGVAAYAGAPRGPWLAAFGAGLAAVLWGVFVGVLGVPFPAGRLLGP
jgi:hypothetical protein